MLVLTAHSSIRRIAGCRSEQKACYRFLNNDKVNEETLILELCERSARLGAQRNILCIQDTTEINLSAHAHRIKAESGLGRLDSSHPQVGFKMHSTLMLDAETHDVLGFSDVQLWHRPPDMPNRRDRKIDSLPVEEKESFKWIEAARKSKQLLTEANEITFIEDREGDFYSQLSTIAGSNVHYIIRSRFNRKTTSDYKAWDTLALKPSVGSITIDLSTDRRKHRSKKTVTLQLRYAKVTIPRTEIKNKTSYPKHTSLNIVEVYEAGKPKGINWKLLTTHSIDCFEDAARIVEWYSLRWTIEQVHRLLKKKGFCLEDSELESGWAIRKLCILMLSALLRILQMNLAYNEPEGGQPIEEVYTPEEIECLKVINKQLQGTTQKLCNNYDDTRLKWAAWIIGRLGGWTGYTSQGPPGVLVLKRGLEKFAAIFYGWQLPRDVGTR